MIAKAKKEWWLPEEQGGFFGEGYLFGDDSEEGPYCDKPMTLSGRTVREVDYIVRSLHLTSRHHLLDCPCGYGRHSIELAKRGIKVTGVDINPAYLQLASKKMTEQDIPEAMLTLKQGDMRSIPIPSESVDVAINWFTSFGFFETDEDNTKVVREFHRVLKPKSPLLIHLDYNPTRVQTGRWQYENRTRHLKNNAKLLVEERYDHVTKKIIGTWTIVDDSESPNQERHYCLRVYSPEEFRTMLDGCGFTNIRILGDLDEPNRELNDQSLETVISATKC